MNEKIKRLLDSPEKLKELADKAAGNTKALEELHTSMKAELDAWVANESATPDTWKALLEATFSPEEDQKDAMVEATEAATTIVGDWNEEAAKLAHKLWENKLGLKRKEMVGYDELFENEEFAGLMAYDRETLDAIPDDRFVFVEEGVRRFPVQSAAEAFLALKSLSLDSTDETEKPVREMAEKFGFIGPTSVVVLTCEGQPIAGIAEIDQVNVQEQVALLTEAYELTGDESEELEKTVESFQRAFNDPITEETLKSFPEAVELNAASIVSKFVRREQQNSHLAPLVGLVRTLNVSKEKFEEAAKTYGCFGVTVLQKLLEQGFTAASSDDTEETNGTSAQNESQVPTLSNPVAQTEETKGKPSPTKSSMKLAYKPVNRRSPKKETK